MGSHLRLIPNVNTVVVNGHMAGDALRLSVMYEEMKPLEAAAQLQELERTVEGLQLVAGTIRLSTKRVKAGQSWRLSFGLEVVDTGRKVSFQRNEYPLVNTMPIVSLVPRQFV